MSADVCRSCRFLPLIVLAGLSLCTCGRSPSRVTSTAVAPTRLAAAARTATDADLQKRQVIKTAELAILSSDPHDGFDKAQRMAQQMGGFTANARREEERVYITLRVPAVRFEDAVRRLCKLGKLERRDVRGQDVTAEVVDLRLRLENAKKMRARYLELLAKAENVAAALQVQQALEKVTASIESMKGKLALLQGQVRLATIHLTLELPTRPGPLGWVFYGLFRGVKWLFVWD